MALTLADFQTEILAALGNRTEGGLVSLARICTALNIAQARLNRAYAFMDMAQVAFAQMNYSGTAGRDKFLIPPANLRTIHSFVLLNTTNNTPPALAKSGKVIEKPWRWFDAHFPVPEALPVGPPQVYARWGRFIVMAPAPDQQYTAQLRYIAKPTDFVVGVTTMSSDFNDKDDILLNYTLAYLWKTLGRADRAAYFEGLAKELLDEAIEKDDDRPDIEVSHDLPYVGGLGGEYWTNPWVDSAR